MYKVIVIYVLPTGDEQTKVHSYRTDRGAKYQASEIKKKLISLGCKITRLRIYKTEQLSFSEQI